MTRRATGCSVVFVITGAVALGELSTGKLLSILGGTVLQPSLASMLVGFLCLTAVALSRGGVDASA